MASPASSAILDCSWLSEDDEVTADCIPLPLLGEGELSMRHPDPSCTHRCCCGAPADLCSLECSALRNVPAALPPVKAEAPGYAWSKTHVMVAIAACCVAFLVVVVVAFM